MKVATPPLRGNAHRVVTAGAVVWAGFVTLGSAAGFIPDAPRTEDAGAKVSAVDPGASTAAVNAVQAWLTDAYPPDSELPAVLPITVRAAGAQWIATVQIGGPDAPTCVAVRVRSNGTALLPPTPAQCLPEVDEIPLSSILDDDTPELRAAAQFAEAWMTGGPVDRFLAPGFDPGALPADRDVTVRSVDKENDRVIVGLNVPATNTSQMVVALSLRLEQINGQWMVNDLQPLQPQES